MSLPTTTKSPPPSRLRFRPPPVLRSQSVEAAAVLMSLSEGLSEVNNDSQGHTENVPGAHVCGISGCQYSTVYPGNLKKHRANIHDVNVVWHECSTVGCGFRTKYKQTLVTHGRKHGRVEAIVGGGGGRKIGGQKSRVQHCTEPGCHFKSKNLVRHRANVHAIGVTWHHCERCEYKAKHKYHLTEHCAKVKVGRGKRCHEGKK